MRTKLGKLSKNDPTRSEVDSENYLRTTTWGNDPLQFKEYSLILYNYWIRRSCWVTQTFSFEIFMSLQWSEYDATGRAVSYWQIVQIDFLENDTVYGESILATESWHRGTRGCTLLDCSDVFSNTKHSRNVRSAHRLGCVLDWEGSKAHQKSRGSDFSCITEETKMILQNTRKIFCCLPWKGDFWSYIPIGMST